MCRAAGIPARGAWSAWSTREQLGGFGPHMWNEVYVNGRWVAIDAAFDQSEVDATHLKLSDDQPRRRGPVRGVPARAEGLRQDQDRTDRSALRCRRGFAVAVCGSTPCGSVTSRLRGERAHGVLPDVPGDIARTDPARRLASRASWPRRACAQASVRRRPLPAPRRSPRRVPEVAILQALASNPATAPYTLPHRSKDGQDRPVRQGRDEAGPRHRHPDVAITCGSIDDRIVIDTAEVHRAAIDPARSHRRRATFHGYGRMRLDLASRRCSDLTIPRRCSAGSTTRSTASSRPLDQLSARGGAACGQRTRRSVRAHPCSTRTRRSARPRPGRAATPAPCPQPQPRATSDREAARSR